MKSYLVIGHGPSSVRAVREGEAVGERMLMECGNALQRYIKLQETEVDPWAVEVETDEDIKHEMDWDRAIVAYWLL